jgi:hypothetical protein
MMTNCETPALKQVLLNLSTGSLFLTENYSPGQQRRRQINRKGHKEADLTADSITSLIKNAFKLRNPR